MKPENKEPDAIDENKPAQTLGDAILFAQRKLQHEGILFILWGWLMFYTSIHGFLSRKFMITFPWNRILNYSGILLGLSVIAFTLWYVFIRVQRDRTNIGISLRYVWISLIIALMATSVIIHRVLGQTNFELQHPVYMMFIAFSTIVTGRFIRYPLVTFGGILFAILAFISAYFELETQLLLEALAWVAAFIIPGHIRYSKKSQAIDLQKSSL